MQSAAAERITSQDYRAAARGYEARGWSVVPVRRGNECAQRKGRTA
jgi:hypothetical protein